MNHERAARRLERKRLAYQQTFCDDKGRIHLNGERVIADLKRFCGWDRAGVVITANGADPHMTFYKAGQQDMLKRISRMIGVDPERITEEKDDAQDSPSSGIGG